MNQEGNYGGQYSDHLLEQYKLYVQMADNISARRSQSNKFYISLLSGFFAILAVISDQITVSSHLYIIIFSFALLGVSLCILWYVNIRSFRQLNSGKFQVIHEMEAKLPFACYDREWDILGEGTDSKSYLQLTKVEVLIPFLFSFPYIVLIIYSLWQIACFL